VTEGPATAEEVAESTTLDEDEHALAKLLLVESREELTRADGKASLLLAALAIRLSAILGAMLSGDWTPFVLQSPWELVWWVGAALAGVAVVSLGVAVWPRVTHKSGPSGVTYFGEAAQLETVLQLHVISRRADHKYAAIGVGLIALGLAIALTLAAVLGDHF
jgi:hypothetical protein